VSVEKGGSGRSWRPAGLAEFGKALAGAYVYVAAIGPQLCECRLPPDHNATLLYHPEQTYRGAEASHHLRRDALAMYPKAFHKLGFGAHSRSAFMRVVRVQVEGRYHRRKTRFQRMHRTRNSTRGPYLSARLARL